MTYDTMSDLQFANCPFCFEKFNVAFLTILSTQLTSNLVLTTVKGIIITPLMERPVTPSITDWNAVGSPCMSKAILRLWMEAKYRPTPGTQRVRD